MRSDWKIAMSEIARIATIHEPEISVLNDDIYDRYILPVRAIDYCLKEKLRNKKLLLPELRKNGNETIAIYSDYGGESKDAAYYTYSILICGWNHSYSFPEYMNEIRERHGLYNKEISFKDIRYGPIKRSLSSYLLELNDSVFGLLLTIAIDKKIKSVFGEKLPDYVKEDVKNAGFGEWKPNVIEKVMRVAHCSAYLTALLSRNGQKIYWVTDNDAIAANVEKHENLMKLFCSILTLYTKNQYTTIGYSLPFEEKKVSQLDFLSCPDLAAGAVEHYLTRKSMAKRNSMKKEAELILSWLNRDGVALKKHTIVIEKSINGGVTASEMVFKNIDLSKRKKAVFGVPVKYKV